MDQVDLFTHAGEEIRRERAPLADRMRPQNLDGILGQEHILGKGKLLRRAIEADRLQSLILWGPPGSGKTTTAEVIAKVTKRPFRRLNAVTDGVKEMRKIIADADDDLKLYGKQSILFIDEIHRFNKSQQDGLLPAVENGTVILIGATTQNPYFSLNAALLSRSLVFQIEPLKEADIITLLKRALKDTASGLGGTKATVTEEALAHLAHMAQGDVRVALNGLELAVLSTPENESGERIIDLAVAEESIQKPAVSYDGTGDDHYQVISAFIKSMRGSDPDATLYYLARMIDAGEDPLFIARRMVIFAAEDVSLADPQGLILAQAAADALQFVGMPEGRIILSEAAVYLALAPKSNATYLGINKALQAVRSGAIGSVPLHLRNGDYSGAVDMGYGKDYRYPHDYPNHFVRQQYLPDSLLGQVFYEEDETAVIRRRFPPFVKENTHG